MRVVRLYPDNNGEAIRRYAQYLLERGDAAKALAVLDQMSPGHRIMNGAPAFLRKRALEHWAAIRRRPTPRSS